MPKCCCKFALVFLAALTAAPANALAQSSAPLAQDPPRGQSSVQGPAISVATGGLSGAACTITLPVRISRLHADIQAVAVVCGLWASEADAQSFNDTSMLGRGVVPVPVALDPASGLRAYSGDVTVPVTLLPPTASSSQGTGAAGVPAQLGGSGGATPTHWACGMSFQKAGNFQAPSPNASDVAMRASGTFVPKVSGKL